MKLHTLTPAVGSVKDETRIGRGQGSGKGGTSARGHKGAKSRSGYSKKAGFEGGQMPLYRRVPKYGFKNPNRVEYTPINLDTIAQLAEENKISVFGIQEFVKFGLTSKTARIKVLARGEVKVALDVTAHAFSASASEMIAKVGGKTTTI